MKINFNNQFDEQTIHAKLRMNKREYQALREYMHTRPNSNIEFPYGTQIIKRGYGWYHLASKNSKAAIRKMQFALSVIKRFLQEEEERVEEEIKKLAPIMLNINLKVVAFSEAHGPGEFTYAGPQLPPQPASTNQLQRLAAKFARHA